MSARNPIEPVPPFRLAPSGEIELRQGGMWLLLMVGIPFVLLGLYLALGVVGLVPVKDEFGKPLSVATTLALSACSLTIGAR